MSPIPPELLHDTDGIARSPEAAEVGDPALRTLDQVSDTTAVLLHDIRAFVRRYVVLTSEQALTIALWVAHTHAIDAADTTPYLSVNSATKQSGKTRTLEVLEYIVRRAWFTGRTSAAALVRKIDADAPTLLLDESDAAFNGDKEYAEALRGILNTGYKRSGRAALCVGKGADINVRDFTTYCPKAIAGIGRLPDTVADRSIPILLKRRLTSEPVNRWHDRDGHAEAEPIHHLLMTWRESAVKVLKAARPALPEELKDRAADVWEPLLAIADLAGGEWPARARRAAVALMGTVEDADPTIELLRDIAIEVFPGSADDIVPTEKILDKLTANEDRPWATWRRDKPISARGLARLLEPLGVHPVRLSHVRGYRRDALDEVIARYLRIQASSRHSTNESAPKPQDGCPSAAGSKNPSVRGLKAESIGSMTHSHIEPEDEGDATY